MSLRKKIVATLNVISAFLFQDYTAIQGCWVNEILVTPTPSWEYRLRLRPTSTGKGHPIQKSLYQTFHFLAFPLDCIWMWATAIQHLFEGMPTAFTVGLVLLMTPLDMAWQALNFIEKKSQWSHNIADDFYHPEFQRYQMLQLDMRIAELLFFRSRLYHNIFWRMYYHSVTIIPISQCFRANVLLFGYNYRLLTRHSLRLQTEMGLGPILPTPAPIPTPAKTGDSPAHSSPGFDS